MTSIALSNHGMTRTVRRVSTRAVVVDRRHDALLRSTRSYYAVRLSLVSGMMTVAMMAGAFIGRL